MPRKTVAKKNDRTLEEYTEMLFSPEERLEMISEAAYYRAQQRGFDPAGAINDWLEAEKVVDEILKKAVEEAL